MTICAACSKEFQQAINVDSGTETPFKQGMIVICVHCGTILCIVSPGESVIADPDIHPIPQEAYDIACNVIYNAGG